MSNVIVYVCVEKIIIKIVVMHSQVFCRQIELSKSQMLIKKFALFRISSLGIKAVAFLERHLSELLKAPHLDECFKKYIYKVYSETSNITYFTFYGLFITYPFLKKSFRKKNNKNKLSHSIRKKWKHSWSEFSGFPQMLVLCAISSYTGFEETPDHLLLNIQLMDMP